MKNQYGLIFLMLVLAGILTATGPARAAAPSMNFTVNMTEAVTVDTTGGTPRIAINVGGTTRYASYASGTGTSALTFTYTATAGDVDLDGIVLTSPVDLNGGTMKDAAGNDATLTFTLPNTSLVNVDYPSMSMDFSNGATGRYTLNGTSYTTLASFLTAAGTSFSRASTGTYFDSTGTLQSAATNTPRFDYHPSTLVFRGLLLENPRTNSLLNSVPLVGSTGTFTGLSNGVTRSISAAGTINGMTYRDLTLTGTFTGAENLTFSYNPAPTTGTAANAGEVWTSTIWWGVVSGTLPAPSSPTLGGARVRYADAGLLQQSTNGVVLTTFGADSHTATAPASTTIVGLDWLWSFAAGQAINVTIRLGPAQLERGAFATSYIPTAGSAATRQGDVMIIPTGSWYNQAAGTFFGNVGWASTTGSNFPMLMRFDDTTNNNRWNMYYRQLSNVVGIDSFTGGVAQGVFQSPAQSTSGTIRAASAHALNNANVAYNGTLGTLDTTWSNPTVTLFKTDPGSARIWLNNVKYYPLRVIDAQLQLLTQ